MILAGLALLILSIIVAILSLFRRLARRERPHITAFLPLVIMLVTYYLPVRIPSKPATIFALYRDEFIALADSSISEFQDTKIELRLPESPLYESASVYSRLSPKGVVVEFIVSDFYLPLVYISTDNPDDVSDTCSRGGIPVERLEPKWYVCRRDWN